MALAARLERYLIRNRVNYDVRARDAPQWRTLVPSDRMAKSVLLKDAQGYLIAVLPINHRIEFSQLQGQLRRRMQLAPLRDVAQLCAECGLCDPLPPVGPAYDLDVVVDASLMSQPEVYFEGGDCELVHMSSDQFQQLLGGARLGRFSRPA